MKPGKILGTFSAKDGRGVALRTPKWEDLDDLLEIINSLVDGKAEVVADEKLSRATVWKKVRSFSWLRGLMERLLRLLARTGLKAPRSVPARLA
jgi:hypothetical protein